MRQARKGSPGRPSRQRSANAKKLKPVLVVEFPTAVQVLLDAHDTPVSSPVGLGKAVQPVPDRRNVGAGTVKHPITAQHETPRLSAGATATHP